MAAYCVNCIHAYQKIPTVGEYYCRIFPRTNLVTGELSNQFAEVARESESMCGKDGLKFEPRTQ